MLELVRRPKPVIFIAICINRVESIFSLYAFSNSMKEQMTVFIRTIEFTWLRTVMASMLASLLGLICFSSLLAAFISWEMMKQDVILCSYQLFTQVQLLSCLQKLTSVQQEDRCAFVRSLTVDLYTAGQKKNKILSVKLVVKCHGWCAVEKTRTVSERQTTEKRHKWHSSST